MGQDRQVKVGIVGLGHNGCAHARCHKALLLSDLVALCDRNEVRLSEAGQELGVSKLYKGDDIYADHIAFPEMAHDDCMVSLFRFDDGSIAKVAALYAPRCEMAPWYNLRVYGTRGTVERDQVAIAHAEDEVHPSFRPVEAEPRRGHPYTPEIEDWLDAILEDRSPRTRLRDGAQSTLATLLAVESARTGREVTVPVF